MPNLYLTALTLIALALAPVWAQSIADVEVTGAFSIEKNKLSDLTLGDAPGLDKLSENAYELELNILYPFNDNLDLFFGGSFFDETEKVKPAGPDSSISGFERGEIGIEYHFGSDFESSISLGRLKFESDSESWIWWDENLDSALLQSRFKNIEVSLGLAREQAREHTDLDFIDPESNGIKRIIASLNWEFSADQYLGFYLLDQRDVSRKYAIDESIANNRIDGADADLQWRGIRYLGEFEIDKIGEIDVELNYAQLDGREIVYDLSEATGFFSTVDEISSSNIDASASAWLIDWSPAALDMISISLGRARGSGDRDADDNRNQSYRQTGLQGDAEVYGKLYQPELSNLVVDSIGLELDLPEDVQLTLSHHDYRQSELAEDMRNVSIDVDTAGSSRNLGSEIDLGINFATYRGIEVEMVVAEFKSGSAYGPLSGRTSRFWSLELNYEF